MYKIQVESDATTLLHYLLHRQRSYTWATIYVLLDGPDGKRKEPTDGDRQFNGEYEIKLMRTSCQGCANLQRLETNLPEAYPTGSGT